MSRIAVVGAGAVGLGCAYELRRRGHDVVILDRGKPGAGCSSGNLGWIVPSFSAPLPAPGVVSSALGQMLRPGDRPLQISPLAVPHLSGFLWRFWRASSPRRYEAGVRALASLNSRTMELFDVWRAEGVRFEMYHDGLLFVFLDRALVGGAQAEIRALEPYGYVVPERLEGDAVRTLEPALSDAVVAGLHVPSERHVRPETLTAGLAERAAGLGVDVRSGVAVESVVTRGRRVTALRTAQGDVTADTFVLAAGARTGQLLRTAGVRVPLQAGKGYSTTVPGVQVRLRHPLYLAGSKVGVASYKDGVRMGGTMELSGINERLDRARIAAIRRGAARYLRAEPDWTLATDWVGMRPITPDGLPLIGRAPRLDNAWLATGHAMLGITLAPATAVLLADLVERGESWTDAGPFDPGRFL
jgi:D-amino-acid dehydrogenase